MHVVVVDPGVGTARRPILMEAAGQYFVAPDNGVLSMVYCAREAQGPADLERPVLPDAPTCGRSSWPRLEYATEHSEWPKTLDELKPKYVDAGKIDLGQFVYHPLSGSRWTTIRKRWQYWRRRSQLPLPTVNSSALPTDSSRLSGMPSN